MEDPPKNDPVNHPPHYTDHPSGVECIQIAEHMNYCLGNVVKYLWRAGKKGDALEDLRKAQFYLNREITRLSAADPDNVAQASSLGEPPPPPAKELTTAKAKPTPSIRLLQSSAIWP